MHTTQLVLLLLALVAVVAAAPTPDHDDDYDYYDYGSSEEDDEDDYRLSSSIFDNVRPKRAGQSSAQPSPCSWAVVHCCGVPDRLGSRASCFSRLGCPGAWFTDICTPTIQKNVLKHILSSQQQGR